MKTIFLHKVLAIFLTLSLVLPLHTFGQGNKKGPPPWAPAHGYRAKTKHVYFPDHNFYFDIQRSTYIYLSGGQWRVSLNIPSMFVGVDLKRTTKVELELNTDRPQKYNADHKLKYKKVKYKENSKDVQTKPKGNSGKGNSKKK